MKKKLLVFLIFFSFFFTRPTPIYAASGFEVLWDWIVTSLSRLVGDNITHITNNKNPSALDITDTFTDYTSDYQDEANRATPDYLKKYNKGVWFYDILTTDKFDKLVPKKDEVIKLDEKDKTVCPQDITVTDIICFHKQQGKKILYKREDIKPIDYSDETLTGKLVCKELNNNNPNPNSCYENIYINYQDIPQGYFKGLDDVAPAVSKQLNDTMRITIANKGQGQSAPDDNDTAEKAEVIALDTDKQEVVKLLGLIPKDSQAKIPCVSNDTDNKTSDGNNLTATNSINDRVDVLGVTDIKEQKDKNRNYLRQSFKEWLTPKSWQTNWTKVDAIDLSDVAPNINCPKEVLRKGGYSQYGALGMAMSGIKYQEILTRYFGDIHTVKKLDFSTKDYTVQVELLEKWKREDGNIDTPEGTKEKYQNCLKLADNSDSKISYEIMNISETKTTAKIGYEGEIPDSNYNCENNWPGTETEFDNKTTESKIKWAKDHKSDFDPETDNPKDIWNEKKDTWNKNCTYRITMSVDDYLMGIAEIFNGWHVEAWKSLIINCRNNLFRAERNDKVITIPNFIQQVFRCQSLQTNKNAIKNGKTTNSVTAVAATDNQFLVDKDDNIIHGNIFSQLCQQQQRYPFYDGTKYETIGIKVAANPSGNYFGSCYANLNPNDPVSAIGVDDGDYEVIKK